MPNAGPQPSRTQCEKFKQYLDAKGDIVRVDEVEQGLFVIQRRGKSTLRVALVDIYTVSESDVLDLIARYSDLQGIVTASVWNGYTPQAKSLARSSEVGLFEWREFMKAVHKDGVEYLAS